MEKDNFFDWKAKKLRKDKNKDVLKIKKKAIHK